MKQGEWFIGSGDGRPWRRRALLLNEPCVFLISGTTKGSRSTFYNTAKQGKQMTDVCLSVCMLVTVPNPTCMPSYCALSCLNQPVCTSFCFHKPTAIIMH